MDEFKRTYAGFDEAVEEVAELLPWVRDELERMRGIYVYIRDIEALSDKLGVPEARVAVSVGPAMAVTPAEMSVVVAEVARLRVEVDQLLGR